MSDAIDIQIRDLTPDDLNFIFSSWLQSFAGFAGSAWARSMRRGHYFSRHHDVVAQILARPTTRVRVACIREDPDVILGWVAFDHGSGTLHYTYTKEPFRRQGIATRLLREIPEIRAYSHRTIGPNGCVERVLRERFREASYDPYAAFIA